MAAGIFLSYRRDDSAHVSGRILDALAARFGRARIFMDVDSVAPGEDFVRKIEVAIRESDVFLAVIGPDWLSATTPEGVRKIDRGGDFIRLEVASALAHGLKIIPVLVDGAPMPNVEDLPDDVAGLTRHNAVQIRHATFRRDVDALVDQLGPRAPAETPAWRTPPMLVGAAGAAALLAIGVFAGRGPSPPAAGVTVTLAPIADGGGGERSISTVAFRTERDAAGRLRVFADLPYRERLRRDGAISGLRFDDHPFQPALPRLAVQFANTTAETITVNEIQFAVAKAEPDRAALPVMREKPHDYRRIKTVNEGWGGFENPRIRVDLWGLPAQENSPGWTRRWRGGVILADPCAAPRRPIAVEPFTVAGVFDDGGDATFALDDRVPDAYDGAPFVCAVGKLTYADAGVEMALAFRTRVSNHRPRVEVAGIALGSFDLFLDSDRAGYTAVVPVLVEVPPGETGTADVTVFTDRTSSFTLTHAVRTASGAILPGETFDLEIFRPRRDPRAYMSTADLDEMTAD